MGQPKGTEESERNPESSPLPEGFSKVGSNPKHQTDAGGSAQRKGVQPLRAESSSSSSVIQAQLDILLALDEPFLLIQELELAACRMRTVSAHWMEWDSIVDFSNRCARDLRSLNEPPPRYDP